MPYSNDRQAVRLYLLPVEHKRVRLAAAMAEVSMAEFCRKAVVDAADAVKIQADATPAKPAPPKKPRK